MRECVPLTECKYLPKSVSENFIKNYELPNVVEEKNVQTDIKIQMAKQKKNPGNEEGQTFSVWYMTSV